MSCQKTGSPEFGSALIGLFNRTMFAASTWTLDEPAQEAYLAVCARVADGPDLGPFKRDHAYRAVLEHVTEAQGQAYLETILADNPQLVQHFKRFQQNDQHGAPFTFNYHRRVFSPTTLRYIKVVSDLIKHFGSLDNMDIVEIGGGYGGQCKIISDVFSFKSYTIADLAPVTRLQERYLTRLGVLRWTCSTPERLDTRRYDLVISNYALSELSTEGKRFYAERVLCRCTRGYLTWNSPQPFDSIGDGTSIVARICDERPNTGRFNKVITWGHG
jgi:putative sugar O-methyltransferase